MSAARRACVACLVVAALNLVAWSLLTPPFHVPDEVGHLAYVQQLAETARPPDPHAATVLSPQERAALDGLFFFSVAGQPRTSPPDVPGEQAALLHGLAENPGNRATGSAGAASLQPPLYAGLQTVPYAAGSGRGILTRLALMRLLSCLLGVITVACVFGFLREALPGAPWAWTAGALVAAFQPLFSFVSSGVDPDALLFAAAAALFWALARAFRLGLSPRRGAAIGAALAIGSVGHLLFLGLVPGAFVALWLLGRREGRRNAGRSSSPWACGWRRCCSTSSSTRRSGTGRRSGSPASACSPVRRAGWAAIPRSPGSCPTAGSSTPRACPSWGRTSSRDQSENDSEVDQTPRQPRQRTPVYRTKEDYEHAKDAAFDRFDTQWGGGKECPQT